MRPTRRDISSGIAAWDADVDENFSKVFDAPFPMFQVDAEVDLPTASSYDSCYALVGDVLYISDGASWAPYLGTSANVPDSTATTAAEAAADLNALFAVMQDAGIMETV